jgi:hypothetical protein
MDRQNRPGRSDSENGNQPGQSDSEKGNGYNSAGVGGEGVGGARDGFFFFPALNYPGLIMVFRTWFSRLIMVFKTWFSRLGISILGPEKF